MGQISSKIAALSDGMYLDTSIRAFMCTFLPAPFAGKKDRRIDRCR